MTGTRAATELASVRAELMQLRNLHSQLLAWVDEREADWATVVRIDELRSYLAVRAARRAA